MNIYFNFKTILDHSPEVSTPEDAREYAHAAKKDMAECVEELTAAFHESGKSFPGAKSLLRAIRKGAKLFTKKTDEEIIAEAAVPFKDTEEGKKQFESLKAVVDYVLYRK